MLSVGSIESEQSLELLKNYKNTIESHEETFRGDYEHHRNDSERLLSIVDSFITNHGLNGQYASMETELIKRIDQRILTSPSVIEKFIDNIHKFPEKFSKAKSSPNHLVFEFYLLMLSTSLKPINALRIAYETKRNLTGGEN